MSTGMRWTKHTARWGVLVLGLSLALGPASQAQAQVSFDPAVNFATGVAPNAVAVGDFDRDGDLDLAVANFGSNNVSVLLGDGNGTFGAKTDFATGTAPSSVAIGDFDRDGDLDLAVTNGGGGVNTVSIAELRVVIRKGHAAKGHVARLVLHDVGVEGARQFILGEIPDESEGREGDDYVVEAWDGAIWREPNPR